jgi:hypothetical protein
LENSESNIWLLVDGCTIYREMMGSGDIERLQTDLNRLGEWAVGNEMEINGGKSKK